MANQVVNRQVNIYIQSGEAQKALDTLIKKEKQLKDEMLEATNPKHMQKLKADLEKLSEPIDRARKKLSGELTPSIRDTQAAVNALGNRMKRLSEEDADYGTVITQYQQASKELDGQRAKIGLLQRAMNNFWREAKTVATGVLIGNSVQAALQNVLSYASRIVTVSAKISDELADIQRVTGLTTKEVSQLNSELKKIDTRTSAESLREIAVVAGKLGVAKNDILGFVAATDKLSVALGDELGDVNTITTELGKILNVFEGKITGDNITFLGNAIVGLANKGVASGPFLVDFTQRLSGIAKTANLSLGAVLGLGAGLEESGQRVESSSTAISKVLNTIATDLPKASKVAGIEIEKFKAIFANSPEEAILLFAQGLQKDKASFAEIAASFKDAGEEGARVISTLATLGTKTDFFREKISYSTAALKEATQITGAFELKNNTLGAQMDKLKKTFANIFASDTFRAAVEAAVSSITGFINVLKAIPYPVTLAGFTALIGILALYTASKIKAISTTIFFTAVEVASGIQRRINNAITLVAVANETIFNTVKLAQAGIITRASAAMRIWNIIVSLGAGPLGIAIVAVAALAAGFSKLFSATKELSVQQQLQTEIAKRVNDATAENVTRIQLLKQVLDSENISYAQKKKALEELIRINPDFANTLKLNADGTVTGTQAIANYITALKAKAEAEAKYQLYVEKVKQRADFINKFRAQTPGTEFLSDDELLKKARDFRAKLSDSGLKAVGELDTFFQLDNQINALEKNLGQLQQTAIDAGKSLDTGTGAGSKAAGVSIDALNKKIQDLNKQRNETTDSATRASLKKQIDNTQKELDKISGTVAKISKEENKAMSETKALAEELRKMATSLMPNDTLEQQFTQQLTALNDKYEKLREKAHGNVALLKQIDQLYILERDRLYVEQAKKFKESLDLESEQNKKLIAARNLAKDALFPLTQKVGDSAVKLAGLIGRDTQAKNELDVIKSSGKKRLDAELRQLQEQKTQELTTKELTENEKLLVEEKYRIKRGEAERKYWMGLANEILAFAGQIVNIFNLIADAKTNKENAELEKDKVANDKKRKNLDERLKKGLISQRQYDQEIEKITKEQEKREREVRIKQFKRDQRAQITQALMSGAGAALKTLETFGPPIPPNFLGIAAMVLTIATTAAQIAKISSAKPPAYGRGGSLFGPSHSDASRGMPVINPYTGNVHAYVEGGEGIINKKSMGDTRQYNITGTPSQIGSAVNALHGGVQWQGGAILKPLWSTQLPPAMNFGRVNASLSARKMYAQGGKFEAAGGGANAAADMALLIKDMINTNAALNQTLANLQQKGIDARVPLSAINDQQSRLNAIRADATMKA